MAPKIATALRSHCRATGISRIELIQKAVQGLHDRFTGKDIEPGDYPALRPSFDKVIQIYAPFRDVKKWGQTTVVVGTKMAVETQRLITEMSPYRRKRADLVSAAVGEYLRKKGYPVTRFQPEDIEYFITPAGEAYNRKVFELLPAPSEKDYNNSDFDRAVRYIRGSVVILMSSFLLALSTGEPEVLRLFKTLFQKAGSVTVTTPDLKDYFDKALSVWRETGTDSSSLYIPGMNCSQEQQIFDHINKLLGCGVEEIPMTPSDYFSGIMPSAEKSSSVLAVMRLKQVRSVRMLAVRYDAKEKDNDKRVSFWVKAESGDPPKSLPVACPGWASNTNFV